MRLAGALWASVLLAGCASIPVATLWKLRSFGVDDIAVVDPAAVRVAGRLEPGVLRIDAARSRLALTLQPRDGGQQERHEFGLRPAKVFNAALLPDDRSWQVFELDAAGRAAMARLKPRLKALRDGYRGGAFSFNFQWTGEMPAQAETLVASVRLQLAPTQAPLVLFDRARIRITRD